MIPFLINTYGKAADETRLMVMSGNDARIDNIFLKVQKWDESTPRDYDRRWVALNDLRTLRQSIAILGHQYALEHHLKDGPSDADMKSVESLSEKDMYYPRQEWDALTREATQYYFEGYQRGKAKLKIDKVTSLNP
jgi:hypothetical protein